MPFTHLHCHSDFSFLDGVGKSIEYAELAARHGHTHLAITDHGNLHGLPAHRKACERFGIKPIYGCELYINDTRDQTAEIKTKAREEKIDKSMLDPTFSDSHLVVLCQSPEGWKNLLAINHDSVRNGYYYKPRTTNDFVCAHAEGLISTTTCIGSLFNQLALRGDLKRLRALLRKFKDAFGERFYREVHINEMPDQIRANAILKAECDPLGIKPVLACDVHYACLDDANRQDEMIAVHHRLNVADPKAFKLTARNLWFMDPKNAWQLGNKWGYGLDRSEFAHMIVNPGEIADSCAADIYPDSTLKPPAYIDDNGQTVTDGFALLLSMAKAGYKARSWVTQSSPLYAEQLKRELQVVRKLGLADFFLVTWDVVRECMSRNVLVWTRGSGCASLLAALIGITPIDPIRFGLLFERFMDPSRPNAPDFDLDINASRRQEIIDWLTTKYGGPQGERIARICAISTYGLKSALRDVLQRRGVDISIAARLADATDKMEEAVGFPISKAEQVLAGATVSGRDAAVTAAFDELKKHSPTHAEFMDQNRDMVRGALTMVGRVRSRTLHAAGFVIGPSDLVEHVPIDRAGTKNDPIITTAWTEGQHASDISPTGLLKLDLLGLETVAVVDLARSLIVKRYGKAALLKMDPWKIDYNDPATVAEFRSGDGFGLHQLGNADQMLARFVKDIRPDGIADIVAAVAAFRPGSMDFIARARGKEPIPKLHPAFDKIVADTKGVLIYQEQIMLVLNTLGGIPLRDAYSCIKAISKKKEKDVAKYRDTFNANATRKIGAGLTQKVWESVEAFAGYGFNKAHAASYAALSWQTAYLRAHFPSEFWLAWLSRTPNKPEGRDKVRKVEILMRHARSRGCKLIAPIVGVSGSRWQALKDGRLLAPLSLIVGIGDAAADGIVEAFREHKWSNLYEFLKWAETHGRMVSSRALTSMAQAGALRKWCSVSHAIDAASVYAEAKKSKVNGTRADQTKAAIEGQARHYRTTIDDEETESSFERHAFGFVFWRDPWEMKGRRAYAEQLIADGRLPEDTRSGDRVRGKRRAFCVRNVRKHTDKKGNAMGFLDLETATGRSVRGVVFSRVWEGCRKRIAEDRVYLIRGEYGSDGAYLLEGKDPVISLDEAMK